MKNFVEVKNKMGKTINQWEKIFRKYGRQDLQDFISGIDRACGIKEFAAEFDWTGIQTLRSVAKRVLLEKMESAYMEDGKLAFTICHECNKRHYKKAGQSCESQKKDEVN